MLHDVPEVFYWIQAWWAGWPGLNLILNWHTPAMGTQERLVFGSRTSSAAPPDSPTSVTCAQPEPALGQSAQGKGPICGRWALMAPSWILSETNSMTVLGRNVHRETYWRSFWRAVAVRFLVSRCAGSQSTTGAPSGGGGVQLLVCLLFWRYRSRI